MDSCRELHLPGLFKVKSNGSTESECLSPVDDESVVLGVQVLVEDISGGHVDWAGNIEAGGGHLDCMGAEHVDKGGGLVSESSLALATEHVLNKDLALGSAGRKIGGRGVRYGTEG